MPQEAIEASLDRVLMVGSPHRLKQLRDQAREVADDLGYQVQFKRLDTLIDALLGSHAATHLTARQALARAAGRPYDPHRIEIFAALFSELNRSVFTEIADPAPPGAARESFAFFEAYFSNYIEGTTFTVEEAENIVFHGQVIAGRSEDSHDILGTFNAAELAPWRDQPPPTADDFLYWLRSVHALVMQKRADKNPGEWKDKPNQAGSTFFVMPELVPGTLREGFFAHGSSNPSIGASHYDDVRGHGSPPISRWKWSHGLARDELHVERAKTQSHPHPNCLPGGLSATLADPQPSWRGATSRGGHDPNTAVVGGFRLHADEIGATR